MYKVCQGYLVFIPRLFNKSDGDSAIASSVCPSRYLLLNHWTKSNQIWCVCCSHKWGMQRHIFFVPTPWGLGEGSKGQILLLDIFKFQSKIFKPNFVCLLTNERYKTYQTGFSFDRLGHAPGVGLGVTVGVGGIKKVFF